jgi:hypothetical protein
MLLAISLSLVGGAFGAMMGWRRGTRRVYRVSYFEDGPYGSDRGGMRRRRRRRHRLVLAILWLFVGALAGFVTGLLMGRG